jgi:hypothetical protein
MHELILKQYFEDELPIEILAADVKNTQRKETYDTTSVNVNQIQDNGTYQVKREHLLKLCNEAISGNLILEDINSIALALVFSEYFVWDSKTVEGEIIETVVYDWDSPEINFPLTIENMLLWRHYLLTGEYKLYSANSKIGD